MPNKKTIDAWQKVIDGDNKEVKQVDNKTTEAVKTKEKPKMTVKELIQELKKQNPEAKISVLTMRNGGSDYTSNPKVTSHKNMFGETVWIM